MLGSDEKTKDKLMKKVLFLMMSILLVLVVACNEEDDPLTPAQMLSGTTWSRTNMDESSSYLVQIRFDTDGSFHFLVYGNVPGHENFDAEYSATDNSINFMNGNDCNAEGIYTYTISDTELKMFATYDSCSTRENEIEGTWTNE